MTNDSDVRYETRTVRTVRGTESRTASKWEKEGWEVVSRSTGKLQTELTLRRPKPSTPRRLYAIVGGTLIAIVVVALIVTGIIRERSTTESSYTVAGSGEQTSPTSTASPSQTPTPTGSSEGEAVVLTAADDAELAAILEVGDYCDSSIAAFVDEHSGQTITFDGSITAMNSHDGASTRYDILIGVGDPAATIGPAFQFRDVNTTSDLRYDGDVPDAIGVGINLSVTAQVDRYEPSSCLLLLEPVETIVRQ